MGKRCVVCCQQEKKDSATSFHRFPCDDQLRKSWLRLLNLKNVSDKSSMRVCSDHFDASLFLPPAQRQQMGASKKHQKRLKRGALPIDCIGVTASATSTTASRTIATQTDINLDQLSLLFEKLSMYEQRIITSTFCIERFRGDDTNIRYFTGFRTYQVFNMVFELLEVS